MRPTPRHTPVRPGGRDRAAEGEGRKVPVGQHQHARAQRAQDVTVRGEGLLTVVVAAVGRGHPRPGPRLGHRHRAQLRVRARHPPRRCCRGRTARRSPPVSGRSRVNPSRHSTRRPAENTPGVAGVPVGPATRANSSLNGAALSRTRALAIDPVPGASQSPQPRPCTARPSASLDITSPYPDRIYSHDTNTKITIRRAGNRRDRTSRTSASSITSSIRSLVNTPRQNPDRDPVRQPLQRRLRLTRHSRHADDDTT